MARNPMSREQDVAYVDAQLAQLDASRMATVKEWDLFREQVSAQKEHVLRDAGVYDVLLALEKSVADRQPKAQARVNEVEAKMSDLRKVREFLMRREEEAPATLPAPPQLAVVPPVPVYVRGIDVSTLDNDTRLMVEAGNPDTLAALRRNPALVEPVQPPEVPVKAPAAKGAGAKGSRTAR